MDERRVGRGVWLARGVLDLNGSSVVPTVTRQDRAAQLGNLARLAGRLVENRLRDGIPAVYPQRGGGCGDLDERVFIQKRGRDQLRRRIASPGPPGGTGTEELGCRLPLRCVDGFTFGLRQFPQLARGWTRSVPQGTGRTCGAKFVELGGELLRAKLERLDSFHAEQLARFLGRHAILTCGELGRADEGQKRTRARYGNCILFSTGGPLLAKGGQGVGKLLGFRL